MRSRSVITRSLITVVAVLALAIQTRATGPQSFNPASLPSGFTQELYGASLVENGEGLFGGVAFKRLDPVVAECWFSGSNLHQFDHATTAAHPTGAPPATQLLHPETVRSFAGDARGFGGCGLVNHPNGKIYANLDPSDGGRNPGAPSTGVAEIDPATWTVLRYFGPTGSALGIAVDPATNHLVYVGQDCEQGVPYSTCTIWDVDPADPVDGHPRVFLQTSASDLAFVDGIYFTAAGDFAFLAGRVPSYGLTVLTVGDDHAHPGNRIGTIVPNPFANPMAIPPIPAVPSIPMDSPPDGISFHAGTNNFLVTNNNDGTLTRFDFPSGYGHLNDASQSVFASGGFRGDLTQVGPDGCIYVTQSAPDPFGETQIFGTRYDDGSTTTETSLVRICEPNGPGFVPTAAVEAMAAHLKLVKTVGGGTASAADFTLSAVGPAPLSGAGVAESDVKVGTYELSETSLPGYTASAWSCSGGTQAGNSVTLALGQSATCTITNTYQPAGQLTIIKHVVNDNGGTAQANAFTLTATGGAIPGGSQAVTGSETGVTLTVNAGDFSVTEDAVAGYTQTGAVGCTGTLALGESATCTITNDDQPAHLTLVKMVVNDSGGTAAATDFTLSAVGPITISGAGGVSQDVTPGSYTLSETGLTGYTASLWSCSGATLTGTSVSLVAGQSATCTITNDDQAALLTVIKHVVNNNGGSASAGVWTMNVTGGHPSSAAFPGSESGTTITLDAGSFSVAESGGPSGYAQTSAVGCAGTLALGQSATCTITNDDQPAHLTLTKVVVNNNGGTAVATDFTLSAAGPTPISGAGGVSQDVSAGSYTLSETTKPGYAASAWSCTGGTQSGSAVALTLGQSATCTITNDDQPAHLTVIKHVVNDNGGSASAGAWTMNVTAGHPSSAAFPGSESGTTITLDAGSFSVSESGGPSGYVQTSAVGCAGTLALGQSATCTITNDDVTPPPPTCTGSIGDFVWTDVNRNGLQDPGEPGIASVVVTLKYGAGVVLQTATTSASGYYALTGLCAGTYTVEVPTPVGLDRTGTGVGSNGAIDSNGSPAAVTLASNSADLTIDFGFVNGFCEKLPVQTVLNPAGTQFPNNRGPDVVVRVQKGQSVQAAVDAASDTNGDGYIIVAVVANEGGILGGNTTQQVVISRQYTAPFALIGCSVTLHDPTPGDGNPTGRVLSTASAPADGIGSKIFLMDLHAEDSAVAGWLVEGNNRYVRNTYGRHNAVGVKFVGSSNTMHNGSVDSNTGAGLVIQGNNNFVTDTNATLNGSHGVWVTGNTNQILKVNAGDINLGNSGDGVHVEGAGNLIQEADAFGNGGDGIEVVASTGSPNILLKNVAGDRGKGNTGNGILVSGPGNGTASPIELEQNTTKANGLLGIRVTGTGHQLKNNVSGGTGSGETNVGCEFNVGSGNFKATGNKANGTTVPGSNGSAFPTGCVGS